MYRLFKSCLLTAGTLCIFMNGIANAGMPSKGLKIDPLLEQAIQESAEQDHFEEQEEPVPVEIVEPEEDKPLTTLPELPTFPRYIEPESQNNRDRAHHRLKMHSLSSSDSDTDNGQNYLKVNKKNEITCWFS